MCVRLLLYLVVLVRASSFAQMAAGNVAGVGTNFLGWQTNGPAVGWIYQLTLPSTFTNSDGKVVRRALPNSLTVMTNYAFDHFVPDSLHFHVWTNLLSRTNGHSTRIWSMRKHPSGWPKKPPIVTWDTNGLMWGMKGLTALSPCWEVEGAPGQVPVTALTRRHGYARGHGLGPEGISTALHGKKVWFLATNNSVVETTVINRITRVHAGLDYTILFFKEDLPATIQPLRVVSYTNLITKYPFNDRFLSPLLKTEQSGCVSADIPGFTLDTWKGGDSGSPNMLLLANELIFLSGRSTSGASPEMQADMDELSRIGHLNPQHYQLQYVDLSLFPSFNR